MIFYKFYSRLKYFIEIQNISSVFEHAFVTDPLKKSIHEASEAIGHLRKTFFRFIPQHRRRYYFFLVVCIRHAIYISEDLKKKKMNDTYR